MTQHRTLGFALAATLVISGMAACKGPAQPPVTPGQQPTASQAPTTSQPGGGQVTPEGRDNAQATAEAMGDEREMDDFDYMAESAQASQFVVSQVGARAAISAAARQRLMERRNQLRTRIASRLTAKAAIAAKLREALKAAPVTTDANGNQTRTFSFSAERTATVGTATRTQTLTVNATVTLNADGVVIYSKYDATQTGTGTGGDRSRSITRTKDVAADGTTTITFHRERTFRDGRVWSADWTKTIALDNKVTGTGTITRKRADGTTKTINLTFGGTIETTNAATTNAEGAQAEVTLPISGVAEAEVGDRAVTVEEDVAETTEATAEAGASPSPSPAAEASPAVSPSPAAS